MTFVHASTLVDDQGAEVLMGWRGTGKTNKVLENYGKKEIWSDDLAILDSNGHVYPYQRPIRLYTYNLDLIPDHALNINKLKRKALITPPWQPVHYWQLPKSGKRKTTLNKFVYLNKPGSDELPQDAEYVMKFEQNFFEPIRIILLHTKVLEEKRTVSQITSSALATLTHRS